MKIKNITRYTYENTDFQGWRVSIQRCGRILTRYFSDLQFESEEASLKVALEYRDRIIISMHQHKNELESFMDQELLEIQQILREKEARINYLL